MKLGTQGFLQTLPRMRGKFSIVIRLSCSLMLRLQSVDCTVNWASYAVMFLTTILIPTLCHDDKRSQHHNLSLARATSFVSYSTRSGLTNIYGSCGMCTLKFSPPKREYRHVFSVNTIVTNSKSWVAVVLQLFRGVRNYFPIMRKYTTHVFRCGVTIHKKVGCSIRHNED